MGRLAPTGPIVRVAVAGKGGAGKTTFSATLARLEARGGREVVAIDGDSNPNLAAALGVEPAVAVSATALPPGLVSRRPGGPALTVGLDDVLDRHGITAPDGVRLVTMGHPDHADEGCLCAAHAVVSGLLGDLGHRPDVLTVVDLEASPEHLSRGTARHADVLVLVVEPYFRSLEAVRRLAALAAELPIRRVGLVANKLRSSADAEAVTEFCGRHRLEHLGEIPWGDAVTAADGAALPLLDAAPDDPVVAAVAAVGARLRAGSA